MEVQILGGSIGETKIWSRSLGKRIGVISLRDAETKIDQEIPCRLICLDHLALQVLAPSLNGQDYQHQKPRPKCFNEWVPYSPKPDQKYRLR